MATKKTIKMARIAPGIRLDGAWADKDTLITKQWTEVSSTLAESLVGSTYQGRTQFEIKDEAADEAGSETEPVTTEDEA